METESKAAPQQEKEQRYKNVVFVGKRKYSGQFLNNKRDGKGREEDKTKNTIYEGYFANDMYHGQGILYQEQTKCYFKGEFEENKKKAGIEIFPNGDIYEGQYLDDKFHGKGFLRNGDLYFHIDDGKTNFSQKDYKKQQSTYSYQGEFSEGKKHGFGTETYIKGAVYVGEFNNNQRHGKGRLQFPNGSYYEGDFVNGMPCGFGVHIAYSPEQISQIKPIKNFAKPKKEVESKSHHVKSSSRGSLYNIEIDSPQKINNDNDEEEESDPDEIIIGERQRPEYFYEGEFMDGMKHGKGRLYFPDGSYYYCDWAFNKKIKEVIYYDAPFNKHCIFSHFEQNVEALKDNIDYLYTWRPGYPPNHIDGYKQAIDACAINGDQFEDRLFKSNENFLKIPENGSVKKSLDIEFKKVKENQYFYFENKDLFEYTIERNSIIYNQLSDYQLITCIEALSQYPHIFFKIFTIRYDISDIGFINLKLYIDGIWKEIIIDDIMPFYEQSKESIFSTTYKKDIGWLALQKGLFQYHSNLQFISFSINFGLFYDILVFIFLMSKRDISFFQQYFTTFSKQSFYIKAFCKLNDSFFYHKHDLKTKKCEEYFQILSGLPCKSLVWENESINANGNNDQKTQIKNMLIDKSKSCKIAYLTEKYFQEKEAEIPQNYPFIVLEAVDIPIQASQIQNQALQAQSSSTKDNIFIIMKSVDPNFSKIKRKSQEKFKNQKINPILDEKLYEYRSLPEEYKSFDNGKDPHNDFEEYKQKMKNSVFALDFDTFCETFGSMYQLVGVNQNFQSSTDVLEDVNVQQSENRYFFTFSLNLPTKILINVEQNIDKIGQLLPVRILLAQDKMGIISQQKKLDPLLHDNLDVISRNKKDFLRRKFVKKVKAKKIEDPKKKDILKGKADREKSANQEFGGEEGRQERFQKNRNDDDNENKMYLKKKYYNFKYIFGKGQYKKKNVFKTISLDEGNYILMVQMEGPDLKQLSDRHSSVKEFTLSLVVSIFGDNLFNIQRIDQPENFIRQVYEACIHQAQKNYTQNKQKSQKNEEQNANFQRSDLGDKDNGSDQIIICQYFLHEEGTYLQLLDNKTDNKSWRQKLYFITENMKIFESNENNKVDVFLPPHTDQLIIIQQVKGNVYHLEGGEGICLIENIQKGDDQDDAEDIDDS